MRVDSEGQTTLEYILILIIALSSLLIVTQKFIKPVFKKLEAAIDLKIQNTLTNSLYRFPVRK